MRLSSPSTVGGWGVSAASRERSTGHPAATDPATTNRMKSLRFALMYSPFCSAAVPAAVARRPARTFEGKDASEQPARRRRYTSLNSLYRFGLRSPPQSIPADDRDQRKNKDDAGDRIDL